jgi:hypothetical protein
VLDQLFGLVLGRSLGVNLFSIGLFVFERPTHMSMSLSKRRLGHWWSAAHLQQLQQGVSIIFIVILLPMGCS